MPLRSRSPGQGRASAKRLLTAEQGHCRPGGYFAPVTPDQGPEFRNRISLKTVTESEIRDSGTESARFLLRIGRCPIGAGHDRQEIPGQARNDYEGLGMTTKGPRNDYEIPDQVGDDERCGQV